MRDQRRSNTPDSSRRPPSELKKKTPNGPGESLPTGPELPALLEYPTRWGILRDLGAFQMKLALDGLKDIVLAPLSLIAAIGDFVIGEEHRGVFLRWTLHLGERFDVWLNLYAANQPEGRERAGLLDEGGSDVLVDYIESTARDVHEKIRGKRRERRRRRGRKP